MKSSFAQLAHYSCRTLKIMLGKSAFLHHEIRVYIGGIVVHVGDDRRCQPVGYHRTALSAAFQRSLARMVVSVEMQFSIIVNASQPVLLVPNHRTEALGFLVVHGITVAVILVSSGFRFAYLHDFTRGVWVGRVVVAVVQRIALLHPPQLRLWGIRCHPSRNPPLRSCFYAFNELLFFYFIQSIRSCEFLIMKITHLEHYQYYGILLLIIYFSTGLSMIVL